MSRTFGEREALRSVDLEVAAGECVALLGPNGSGKSTLLRIACGRDRPTAGTVEFDGEPMAEDDVRVRVRVAVVGDALSCYPDLTARQHLELVAVAHDVPAVRIDALLREQRLTGHADSLPGALSSGQLQALLLASALLRPRDLLVLDEPEQRLDPRARGRLADVLRAESDKGVAVLFATHQPELARAAHRVIALDDGAVVADGSPDEVLTVADA
ncbi:ABC transporter ATP-binding protein [Streptomyces sp. M2CJ-2]|uniref:ABC transporter ATP-binding protein n=1 Tax=Streptomyces sp. M2CJ-2 TaxID=2803948 RepID=UPI0027DB1EEA|nr:ABC transporter ATP-binding protein [Streptomyces sp. M2CJ-2]